MGKGFLGTPASLMLDVVVVSLLVVTPALLYSLYVVKFRRDYILHKRLQVVISVALFLVVGLFEIDMKMQGGFDELAKGSALAGTAFLDNLLAVHLCFSISTFFLWAITFLTALRYFPVPPVPTRFGRFHRVIAWITVADMIGTIVTGLMVYWYGFVAK